MICGSCKNAFLSGTCLTCGLHALRDSTISALEAENERLRAMVPSEEEREALSLVVDTLMCAINPGERRAAEAVRVYLRRLTAAKEADRG